MIFFMVNDEDRPTIAELYDAKKKECYDLAISYTHSSEKAWDIVHDSFADFMDKFEERRDMSRGEMARYLKGIIKPKCYAEYRNVEKEFLVDDVDWIKDPDADIDRISSMHFEREVLSKAVKQLPPRSFEYLHLSYGQELPPADVAAVMGVKPASICEIQKRAKDRLRKAVQKISGGELCGK